MNPQRPKVQPLALGPKQPLRPNQPLTLGPKQPLRPKHPLAPHVADAGHARAAVSCFYPSFPGRPIHQTLWWININHIIHQHFGGLRYVFFFCGSYIVVVVAS